MTAPLKFPFNIPYLDDQTLLDEYLRYLGFRDCASHYIDPIRREIHRRIAMGLWTYPVTEFTSRAA